MALNMFAARCGMVRGSERVESVSSRLVVLLVVGVRWKRRGRKERHKLVECGWLPGSAVRPSHARRSSFTSLLAPLVGDVTCCGLQYPFAFLLAFRLSLAERACPTAGKTTVLSSKD